MIYTFSPNWYKQQCLLFQGNFMYYGSNSILFRYNLQQKAIQWSKNYKHLEHGSQNKQSKDIKITCISHNSLHIIVAFNQNIIVLLKKSNFQQTVYKLQHHTSIDFLFVLDFQCQNSSLLVDMNGLVKLSLESDQSKFQQKKLTNRQKETNKVKKIVQFIYKQTVTYIVFYLKGNIEIFDKDFLNLTDSFQMFGQSILSVDILQSNLCLLTKKKEQYFINLVDLKNKKEQSKFQQFFFQEAKGTQIKIIYPKKFHQKLKQNYKACMTIKILSQKQMILTGKLGQIYSIYYKDLKQKLQIYPYSLRQDSLNYDMWSDSKHYKQIYAIYEHQEKYFMIGTDHILSVWIKKQSNLKYYYSIKFLTSPVCQIFFSQSDPKTIFTLLKDSIIRSCSPLEYGSHFLNEHWKYTSKFKVSRAMMHIEDLGIVGLITKCNKVIIYDLFEDRLMKIMDFSQQISTISFQKHSIKNAIQCLYQEKFIIKEIQHSSYFIKKLYLNVVMVVQLKQRLFIVENYHQKQIKSFQIPKKQKLERLYQTKYWDEQILLSTKKTGQKLNVFVSNGKQKILHQLAFPFQNSRYIFKRYSKDKFYLVNYKNNKICIFNCTASFQENVFDVKQISQIILANNIQNVVFNHNFNKFSLESFCPKLAVHNQKDELFHVILLNTNNHETVTYKVESKIQCLSFYQDEYIIFGFKNQTLKIAKYEKQYQVQEKSKKDVKEKKLQNKNREKLSQMIKSD